MPAWPASLPQEPDVGTWSETPPNLLLRQEMDTGPPHVRRTHTAGIRTLKGTFTLWDTQVSILDDFIYNTIKGGSIEFNFPHPRTNQTVSVMVKMPVVYRHMGGNLYKTDLEFEIKP